MGALPEEQRSAEESSRRNYNDTATLLGTAVDDGLYFLGLHPRPASHHTIVCQHILLTQHADIYFLSVLEPAVYHRAVGPQLRLFFYLFSTSRHNGQC